MEGQVFGNRYEIIEKIGGGGMSIVYKAKCRLLNRFVAVKVLRPKFTQDDEFVKRFRVEAQSAASLSHPNIVSIYDVGNEHEIYYIVMEYIDGITLKEYIDSKSVIPWNEAIHIGMQIGSAIEHAHKNHIIHRDIKPHNIILTKEGIAKVTDFGIARAVSSSTITMVGSTIGSVHYFSPEQARGGFVDEKSDLYSLGITLYEMVTGRIPFDGETPIAVALKHIQVDAEPPIGLQPDIPRSLNDIIMKGITKEQNKRYQNAAEFLYDLSLALKDPQGDFVVLSSGEESPTRRIRAIDDTRNNSRKDYLIKEQDEVKKTKKADRVTIALAIITAIVVMVSLSYIIGVKVFSPLTPNSKRDFVVENYVGKSYEEVKRDLNEYDIEDVDVEYMYDKDNPEGTVIWQSVEKGRTLKPGGYGALTFKVSKGIEKVKIPELKNVDYREAEDALTNLGISVNRVTENSDTIPENKVIRTDPPVEEEVVKDPNTVVTLYVSSGPELRPTKVPNLIGKTQKEAIKLLELAKLVIGKQTPEVGSDFTILITSQYPLPNADANEGDAVDLFYEKADSQVVKFQHTLELNNPEGYGDTLQVRITARKPGSDLPEVFMDQLKSKVDFPFTVSMSYPKETVIDIFLDNKPYQEFIISPSP